jgi:hypothetical protein
MTHTSFDDVDHDGTGVAPTNLDEIAALNHDEESKSSEEDVLAEIDRYMVDLLDRTQQRSTSLAASAATPESKLVRDRQPGEERRVQDGRRRTEKGRTGAAAEGAVSPAEPPRKKRPPQEPDLLPLREIAKNSAQDAISLHDSKLAASRARGKLSVTIVAACAAALLFWAAPSPSAGTFPIALLAVLIAGIWGTQSLRLLVESRRLARLEPPVKAS